MLQIFCSSCTVLLFSKAIPINSPFEIDLFFLNKKYSAYIRPFLDTLYETANKLQEYPIVTRKNVFCESALIRSYTLAVF